MPAAPGQPSPPLRTDPSSGSIQYLSKRLRDGGSGVDVAAGYRRDEAFDPSNARGQDYVAERSNAHHVVAVVADGVSQSFFGDIAAGIVGERLVEFLWSRREQPPTHDEVMAELADISDDIGRRVARQKHSAPLGSMFADFLEETRNTAGSQAKFTDAIFDPKTGDLYRYHCGDVTATTFGAAGMAQTCFKTRSGGVGNLPGKTFGLEVEIDHGVRGFTLTTDGVDPLFPASLENGFDEATWNVAAAPKASSDDQAFFSARAVRP